MMVLLSRARAAMITLACASAAMMASAAPPADVFDGLQPELIGAQLTSVLEGAELACKQDREHTEIRRCRPLPGALDNLGGVAIASVEATFVDDRLSRVTIYFPEPRFPAAEAVLAARMGEAKDRSYIVRAGMAGTFVNRVLVWESDDRIAIAQQYDGKIDRSSLVYGSREAMAESLRNIESGTPGVARDL
jgi:hypothetical protein